MRTFMAERLLAEHELRSRMYQLLPYFLARSCAESYLQVQITDYRLQMTKSYLQVRRPRNDAQRGADPPPLQGFFALIFATLARVCVGLAPSLAQLVPYLLIVCVVTLVAESYVIFIGCVMPDEKSAAVVSPVRRHPAAITPPWHLAPHTPHVAPDALHVAPDPLHVAPDALHVAHPPRGT